MTFAVFQKIIERYLQDQARNIGAAVKQLLLVFHGGEPTLLGAKELRRFMNYARSKIPYIRFGIQTNLTNISPELAALFKKYSIVPGISVDGWHSRSNSLRMNGKKSPVLENVRKLKKYHIDCGPLLVVNKANIKKTWTNIIKLIRNFAIPGIKANYVENIYSPDFVYPECRAEELFKELFLPTIKHLQKKQQLVERNAEGVLSNFFNALIFQNENSPERDCHKDNCQIKFCTGGNKLAEVDAEGVVLSCGRWDDVHELCRIGSVEALDFWGISSYSKVLALQCRKAAAVRQKHCDSCPAGEICSYGCLAFSYAKYGDIRIRADSVCAYYKQVWQYLLANASVVLKSYAAVRNWEIAERRSRNFQVFFPKNAPRLNEESINKVSGWSIGQAGAKTCLQVRY
ncbi:putative anaerobic sulfatase maturase [Candidatus Termititenax aidoneus]|uniref:Anaerobic sulfatase maturase n=1 Tax=Termititenax aidoneus TaxID=2218524 RepID=A0A388TBY5_TERA1|nr:putative anaerobic sulfatase maturase [Candidatus Termititenax aidoneus]